MRSLSRLLAVFAICLLAAFGAAAQQARTATAGNEPTLAQIYQAASSGELDRANSMIDEVLKSHPNSARAHYVKAELAARGQQNELAQRELATAEKIAPGLPFAKPESVQALRRQIASNTAAPATSKGTNASLSQQQQQQPAPTRQMGAAPGAQSFPWGMLLVVGAVIVVGAMMLRRRQRAMEQQAANWGNGGGYGNPAAPAAYDNPQPYGPQPYGPQPGYGPGYPQQQPSMGSSIARGVATGLAVGAGAVAAQEIGRRMFEHGNANASPLSNANHDSGNAPTLDQIDEGMRRNLNTDMGGDNFGVADGGWDDGGGDVGGGGDWDT